MAKRPHGYDKIVFLLQGGGALGAYQMGVCEALMQNGCLPDWLVGTSIGAINATIIAGNKPENRIKKLHEFWDSIATRMPVMPFTEHSYGLEQARRMYSSLWTMAFGQHGFFHPRLINPWINLSDYPDEISFYDTRPLKQTLRSVIDFDIINQKKVRLTLAAVHVEGGQLVYFDNFKQEIGPEHVMASGALPPGFPAVQIGGNNYWDGGISSNTPLIAVLQESMHQKLLCIMVHLFSYYQRTPSSMMEVLKLKKNIEYSSRYHQILTYLCEVQSLHNHIRKLIKHIPQKKRSKEIQEILKTGNPLYCKIVRFHYRDQPANLWTKDFEFSTQTLETHQKSGIKDVTEALKTPDWLKALPRDGGVVLREF